MKCTIQAIITTDDGQEETWEMTCRERGDFTTTTLGPSP
jgi:hypothetical protein